MSVFVVYRRASDYGREVEEYLRDFEHRTGKKLEEIDPDTRDGATLCRTYDIVEYPTIIATAEDGQVRGMWRGTPLPTIDEVSYYVINE